jgi:SAM-dependent methyltransferase
MSSFPDPVPANALDPDVDYPANAFAFRYVLPALLREPGRNFLEIGVGSGAALQTFSDAGFEVTGFDNDDASVVATQARATELGLNPHNFSKGDLREPASYAAVTNNGPYDGIVGMGVLPHISDKAVALANVLDLTAPGGQVFMECRNLLFGLTTFNRFTHSLVMDDLLGDIAAPVREIVNEELSGRVHMDVPGSVAHAADAGENILEPFDNPLTVPALFDAAGFADVRVHYFHYHAGMPYLQSRDPAAFRAADVTLEEDTSGWRGMFLASAFLVHARKPAS